MAQCSRGISDVGLEDALDEFCEPEGIEHGSIGQYPCLQKPVRARIGGVFVGDSDTPLIKYE